MTYQSLSPIDRTILASRSFRQQLEQQLHTYHIDGQDFAVISAMAMGDKGSLDQETKESFPSPAQVIYWLLAACT